MNNELPRFRFPGMLSGAVAALALLFVTGGCGSSEQTQEEMEAAQASSPTARLEYRIDSLQNENHRMKEQVNALAAENRSLTAKNAELETKLTEAPANPAPAAAPTASADPTADYTAALAAFRKHDFNTAIQGFESLLNASVDESLADNCHYWMGESYYGLKKYSEAIKEFNEVLGFKKSEKKADALLMMGNAYAAMGQKDEARKAYDKVASTYPAQAKKAQEKLARMK